MTDTDFLDALEKATLDPAHFNHRAHVRAGFLILQLEASFPAALQRIESAIKTFAAAHGKTGLYHETITIAFMALINMRMHAMTPGASWQAFIDANPDLLTPAPLRQLYTDDLLHSQKARAVFQLPLQRAGNDHLKLR